MKLKSKYPKFVKFIGRITGISDLDPVRWRNSQWLNLQDGMNLQLVRDPTGSPSGRLSLLQHPSSFSHHHYLIKAAEATRNARFLCCIFEEAECCNERNADFRKFRDGSIDFN